MPLPKEDTTPPVTKMYFVIITYPFLNQFFMITFFQVRIHQECLKRV